ncbi:DUF6088 family protein [Deinococcus sonorensis]|uniref:DUF6088 family protein n=2 Tax=Deinococcus sonorensis TaxID=309891 RepID=A0AAU7U738_9DEIO
MAGTATTSSIHAQVRRAVQAMPAGVPFCFADLEVALPTAHRKVLQQALSRLVKAGEVSRIMRGIYMVPKPTLFGPSVPPVWRVVEAYARQHRLPVGVHGAIVVNELGLSTQVPSIYLYNAPIHARRPLNLPVSRVVLTPAPRYVIQAIGTSAEQLLAGLEFLGPGQPELCARLIERCGEAARETACRLGALPRWMEQALTRKRGAP